MSITAKNTPYLSPLFHLCQHSRCVDFECPILIFIIFFVACNVITNGWNDYTPYWMLLTIFLPLIHQESQQKYYLISLIPQINHTFYFVSLSRPTPERVLGRTSEAFNLSPNKPCLLLMSAAIWWRWGLSPEVLLGRRPEIELSNWIWLGYTPPHPHTPHPRAQRRPNLNHTQITFHICRSRAWIGDQTSGVMNLLPRPYTSTDPNQLCSHCSASCLTMVSPPPPLSLSLYSSVHYWQSDMWYSDAATPAFTHVWLCQPKMDFINR